ncbi:Aste57867_10228 [Aphanomyces stellatus]|uniref:Aste57867_10228 protein n=1 Tax=Aphanomyces stellatus TaxID=120398 RepID=A0A485KPW7_9STRA|nr:hypothetical protein As57867_010189 [Aphanomyces stellatus]VFT87103.1 Aste57867_10228 [Aphanomyces stellatus]
MPHNEHKIPHKDNIRAKDRFRLPPKLLQHIALFIRDTSVFFTYLEAFHQDDGILGNLQHLWTLSMVVFRHDRLWPTLHIRPVNIFPYKELYIPILAYYSTVHVLDVFDLAFLQQASTSTTIAMSGFPQEEDMTTPLDDWYRTLPALRISDVTWCNPAINSGIQHLLTTLPRMPHVRSLNLARAIVPSITSLVDFVASSQLTSINFSGIHESPWRDAVASSAMDARLTSWLQREPVTHVALGHWDLRSAPNFIAALWQRNTLKQLVLTCGKIPPLDAVPFGATPLTTSHVDIGASRQRPVDVLALARGIAHSPRLVFLSLMCNHVGPAQELMHAIVHSNVCELNLAGCDLGDTGCVVVAKCLHETKLTTLDLGSNDITIVGALELASAIIATPQLGVFSLRYNHIQTSGVVAVIQAFGGHSRQAKLDVYQYSVSDDKYMDDLPAVASRFPQLNVVFAGDMDDVDFPS